MFGSLFPDRIDAVAFMTVVQLSAFELSPFTFGGDLPISIVFPFFVMPYVIFSFSICWEQDQPFGHVDIFPLVRWSELRIKNIKTVGTGRFP